MATRSASPAVADFRHYASDGVDHALRALRAAMPAPFTRCLRCDIMIRGCCLICWRAMIRAIRCHHDAAAMMPLSIRCCAAMMLRAAHAIFAIIRARLYAMAQRAAPCYVLLADDDVFA